MFKDTKNLAPFDASRAILQTSIKEPLFTVETTTPLQAMVASGQIPNELDLQIGEIHGKPMAFITAELLMFDAAQSGAALDPAWLVSFCPICNSGAIFSPIANDGIRYTFAAGGIYNAMAILRDVETGSYWNHIHGICVHGEKKGASLKRMGVLRHMRPRQALAIYPQIGVALAPLTEELRQNMAASDTFRRAQRPDWSKRLMDSWVNRDERLIRYDMGLGIWTADTARYYPILRLHEHQNAILDTLDGRRLLVYVDPSTDIPDAMYVEASQTIWHGDVLSLGNGITLRDGILRRNEEVMSVERPLHLFIRWYGFAALFQGTEIYLESRG